MTDERFTVDVGDDPGPEPHENTHLERARMEMERSTRGAVWTSGGAVELADVRRDLMRDGEL
jgi:hypothetical protein